MYTLQICASFSERGKCLVFLESILDLWETTIVATISLRDESLSNY